MTGVNANLSVSWYMILVILRVRWKLHGTMKGVGVPYGVCTGLDRTAQRRTTCDDHMVSRAGRQGETTPRTTKESETR